MKIATCAFCCKNNEIHINMYCFNRIIYLLHINKHNINSEKNFLK